METNLHRLAVFMLGLALLVGALHLLESVFPGLITHEGVPPLLTFLAGFLPALGAAIAAIINQAEFRRIAKRSKSMAGQLKTLLASVKVAKDRIAGPAGPGHPQPSVITNALMTQATHLMMSEVLDWRVVFQDRPLDVT